jgi:hypothetical protein
MYDLHLDVLVGEVGEQVLQRVDARRVDVAHGCMNT